MDLTTNWNSPSIDMQAVSAKKRCDICTRHASGHMVALRERLDPPASTSECRTWLLCEGCAAAVVTEVRRSALHTPLRTRIAVGLVAAERRPVRRKNFLDKDFWERMPGEQLDRLVITFVLCMFAIPPLLFLLIVAFVLPAVTGQ